MSKSMSMIQLDSEPRTLGSAPVVAAVDVDVDAVDAVDAVVATAVVIQMTWNSTSQLHNSLNCWMKPT